MSQRQQSRGGVAKDIGGVWGKTPRVKTNE